MLENHEATVTKNALTSNEKQISLLESTYDNTDGGGKGKPNKPVGGTGEGAIATAGLPKVEIVDGGKVSGAAQPALSDAGKPSKAGKAHADHAAVPNGGGAVQSVGPNEMDGRMDSSATELQFKYSKVESSPKALTMFGNDELDLDGNGFVNRTELDRKREELLKLDEKQLGKSKETTLKLQAVNYMIADYDKLRVAHDDEYFSEDSGISIHDLASTVSDVNRTKRPH